MANRFWVGGAGNWTDTNHWSSTSNGPPGAAVPTASDDVYIDSNSFGSGIGNTLTLDTSSATCKSFTGAPAYSADVYGNGLYNSIIYCKGAFSKNSSLSFIGEGLVDIDTSATTSQITLSGMLLPYWGVVLSGNLLISTAVYAKTIQIGNTYVPPSKNTYVFNQQIVSPSIVLNGGQISIGNLEQDPYVSNVLSVNTNGTYPPQITQSGSYIISASNTTLYLGQYFSQRVNLSSTTLNYAPNVAVNVQFSNTATTLGTVTVSTKINFTFQAGKTHYIDSFNFTSNNTKTFQSSLSGSQYTISSGSAGDTITLNNLNVKDSIVIGASTWVDNNGVNSGNNTGWIFNNGGAMATFF